ncbi:MAG: hypothetical protein KatS3mg102_2224 [Planctomycetota bacterium]|nr:MAG: hypothetical protein KatS3mg102_2224 [Planctomycetota bacterium]
MAIDGRPVQDPDQAYQVLNARRGKTVELTVLRGDPAARHEVGPLAVPEEGARELVAAEAGEAEAALKRVDLLGTEIEPLGPEVGREFVMREILADARRELGREDVDLGIHIEDILVKTLIYTKDVERQVYAQMNAELQRWSARFRSIGRAQAEERLGEMERELAAIRSSAVRESRRIRGEGDAEATRIYAEAYQSDLEFYALLRLLEGYKKALAERNHVLVLRPDGPFFELLSTGRVEQLLESFRELEAARERAGTQGR